MTLHLTAAPGESDATVIARATLSPAVRAGLSLAALPQPLPGTDLTALVAEMTVQQARVRSNDLGRCDESLVAQADTLDALFHELTRKAIGSTDLSRFNIFMQLALKAQNQSRSTYETLAKIKNPPQVAYVRQANIGQAVQVINGQEPPPQLTSAPVALPLSLRTADINAEIGRLQNELLLAEAS